MSDSNSGIDKKAIIAIVILAVTVIVLITSVALMLGGALAGTEELDIGGRIDGFISAVSDFFTGGENPPATTPAPFPSPAPPVGNSAGSLEGPAVALVGTWQCLDTSQPHQWMCFLIFNADGSFVDGDGDVGVFIVEGNSLTFAFDDFHPITLYFDVEGDQLRVFADGLNVILTRQSSQGAGSIAGYPLEGQAAALVGTWQCLDTTLPHEWICWLIFNADGTFVDNDGDMGIFIVEGNSLTFAFDDFHPITLYFDVDGDQLRIFADGLNVILNRQL